MSFLREDRHLDIWGQLRVKQGRHISGSTEGLHKPRAVGWGTSKGPRAGWWGYRATAERRKEDGAGMTHGEWERLCCHYRRGTCMRTESLWPSWRSWAAQVGRQRPGLGKCWWEQKGGTWWGGSGKSIRIRDCPWTVRVQRNTDSKGFKSESLGWLWCSWSIQEK